MPEPDDAWRFSPPLLVGGVVLVAAALAQPLLAWLIEPRWAWGLAATMAAELVSGRETSIPFALDQGVPPGWIAATSILENLALAALLVPLALAGLAKGERARGPFGRLLVRLHATAAQQRHRAASAWALFLFMLVPFLPNGAAVAGLLGSLAGIPRRRLILAVTAGVVVTATAWSFAYAALAHALASVDPRLARLPGIAALLLVALAVLRFALVARKMEA